MGIFGLLHKQKYAQDFPNIKYFVSQLKKMPETTILKPTSLVLSP